MYLSETSHHKDKDSVVTLSTESWTERLASDASSSAMSSANEAETAPVEDPKVWFPEIQRYADDSLSTSCGRRSGIMVIRSARDSGSRTAADSLRQAARVRRSLRFQKHGISGSISGGEQQQPPDVRVTFTTVQIREHGCILGDNPGGTAGPPLTIEWACMSDFTADLEEYEESRPPRRDHLEMQMPASYRRDLLQRAGYTRGEITELTKPVNVARSQRARTREAMKLDGVNELVEKLSRGTLNVLTLGMRKRKERAFLKPYVVMSRLCEKETLSSRATSPSWSVTSCGTVSMEFTEPSETLRAEAMIESPAGRDVSPGRERSAIPAL